VKFTHGSYFIIPFFPPISSFFALFLHVPLRFATVQYNCWVFFFFLPYFVLSHTLKAHYRKRARVRKKDSPFHRDVTLSPLSLEMHPLAIYRQSNNWSLLVVVLNRVYDPVALVDKSTFVRGCYRALQRGRCGTSFTSDVTNRASTVHITDQRRFYRTQKKKKKWISSRANRDIEQKSCAQRSVKAIIICFTPEAIMQNVNTLSVYQRWSVIHIQYNVFQNKIPFIALIDVIGI